MVKNRRRVVFDIESNSLLNSRVVDYSKFPYTLKRDVFTMHCIVAKDIDTNEYWAFYDHKRMEVGVPYTHLPLSEFCKWMSEEVAVVIGHNIIGYDLQVLSLWGGAEYSVISSLWNGRHMEYIDTLVMSRLLNPDRFGGHSLDSWGQRTGLAKIAFGKGSDANEEVWEVFTEEMLVYCFRDVDVGHRTFTTLREEWGNWDWSTAFKIEQGVSEIISHQEHFGFHVQQEKARASWEWLNQEMAAIEARVEPLLPERPMSKTSQKSYTAPKQQFVKSGEISKKMETFLENHKAEVVEWKTWEVIKKGVVEEMKAPKVVKIYGKLFELPMNPEKPVKETEPMKLSNQTDIKEYLLSMGWDPVVWNEKDLTVDDKKKKLTAEKWEETKERYIESTVGTSFLAGRSEGLEVDPRGFESKVRAAETKKPFRVRTAPSYTIDQDKNLCPNLQRLGAKFEWVGDVVKWLTYRHRRNSILSLAEDSKTKKNDTGFLAHDRLGVDGRIPTPAIPLGAVTGRMQHKEVANIPRTTSLFGGPMREIFSVPENMWQIGYDASGLEARIEGHYTFGFTGGKAYAETLLQDKPNDVHSLFRDFVKSTANIEDFERDEAKAVRYGCAYGASAGKVAKMLAVDLETGKLIFDLFWENAFPLKVLKEVMTKWWQNQGERKFIVGIDGRKLMVRSQHSIINTLFQSAGVICMKVAMLIAWQELKKKGLLWDIWKQDINRASGSMQMIAYHDEGQQQVSKDLVKWWVFDTKEEAVAFKEQQEKTTGKLFSDIVENQEGVGEGWAVAYSIVGEILARSVEKGGKFFNLNVPLAADYVVGKSWKDCH